MSSGVVVRCSSGRSRAIFGAAKGFVPRAALHVFEGGRDQEYVVFCSDYLLSVKLPCSTNQLKEVATSSRDGGGNGTRDVRVLRGGPSRRRLQLWQRITFAWTITGPAMSALDAAGAGLTAPPHAPGRRCRPDMHPPWRTTMRPNWMTSHVALKRSATRWLRLTPRHKRPSVTARPAGGVAH
jgi:hypothetical protein